jgi:hypothetical protein
MKQIVLVFLFSIGLAHYGHAQRATYLGAEGGLAQDQWEYTGGDKYFNPGTLVTGYWGFTLRQEVFGYFSVESGLFMKYYTEGFGFNTNLNYFSYSNSYNTFQIPVRFITNIDLLDRIMFFTPFVGIHFGINSDYDSWGMGWGSIFMAGSDSVTYYYESQYMEKSFMLLEAGFGLEFVIAKKLHLNVSTSYFTGFKKLASQEIYYAINSNPLQNVKQYSKGEYWALSLGFSYPISDIWKKSPETPGPENK